MKNESALKSAFIHEAKRQLPSFVFIRHEDVRTAGTPDLSATGYGKTSWLEFKHATPRMTGTGYQELTCLRLAAAGFCRYVVYMEKRSGIKSTLIVHPRHIREMLPEVAAPGHDHLFVVNYLRQVHSA